MLSRMKTNSSKLLAARLDLLALRMSPAELNMVSIAAELWEGVLYLIKRFTHPCLYRVGDG